MLRIRDVYPESEFSISDLGSKKIPDPVPHKKNSFQALGNMIRDIIPDPNPDFFPHTGSRIQGSKRQGTGSRIRNTGIFKAEYCCTSVTRSKNYAHHLTLRDPILNLFHKFIESKKVFVFSLRFRFKK